MDAEQVGKAIAYMRKRAGFTQRDLAVRLGVTDKAISKWERGAGLPDISLLTKLSILLDTDIDNLLAGDVISHDLGWCGLLVLDKSSQDVDSSTMVCDKPLIYYLLGYFLLSGIRDISIACPQEEREYIQELLGDGGTLGFKLTFITNQEGFKPELSNVMVVYGRNLIYGVDQTRFFQRAMLERNHVTVLSLPRQPENGHNHVCFDAAKKVVSEDDETKLWTQYHYCEVPVFFCPSNLLEGFCFNEQDPFGGLTQAIENETLYTEVLDRGFVVLPMDTLDEVQEASTFVDIVQRACGMHIYCIEEIAWRRGFIDDDAFRSFGESLQSQDYGRYIIELVNGIQEY